MNEKILNDFLENKEEIKIIIQETDIKERHKIYEWSKNHSFLCSSEFKKEKFMKDDYCYNCRKWNSVVPVMDKTIDLTNKDCKFCGEKIYKGNNPKEIVKYHPIATGNVIIMKKIQCYKKKNNINIWWKKEYL